MLRTITIEECQKFAASKNGKCLSMLYISSKDPMDWECEFGHRWTTTYSNIYHSNHWCSVCSGNKKHDIEYARNVATKRGGVLISTVYVNSNEQLEWKCQFNHIFCRTLSKVVSGRWCQMCGQGMNVSEEICRVYFETLLGYKFPKIRPDWLKYKSNLELDGYCAELNLAFEHNGRQHNEKVNYFNFDDEKLTAIMQRDAFKIKKCKEQNVRLIIVPELFHTLKLSDLKQFIIDQCSNIHIPIIGNIVDIDLSYINPSRLRFFQNLAIQKGGRCLSDAYIRNSEHLWWECAKKHTWQATPANVLRGTWCKECYGNIKYTIEEVKQVAINRGGECLSGVYDGNHSLLLWKCQNNHIWKATFNSINVQNTWCDKCIREKRNLERSPDGRYR